MQRRRLCKLGYGILGNNDETEGGCKTVDAVTDFRVDMVRSSGKNHHAFSMLFCKGKGTLTLGTDVVHVLVICGKACTDSFFDCTVGNRRSLFAECAGQRTGKNFFGIEIQIGIEEIRFCKGIHIAVQKLGIISHDGTVIVVRGLMLVDVVGQTRIEDCVHAALDQLLNVTVHDLCGIACRIGRNGELSFFVCRPTGRGGQNDLITEFRENFMPQDCKLIHTERHRKTDCTAGAGS